MVEEDEGFIASLINFWELGDAIANADNNCKVFLLTEDEGGGVWERGVIMMRGSSAGTSGLLASWRVCKAVFHKVHVMFSARFWSSVIGRGTDWPDPDRAIASLPLSGLLLISGLTLIKVVSLPPLPVGGPTFIMRRIENEVEKMAAEGKLQRGKRQRTGESCSVLFVPLDPQTFWCAQTHQEQNTWISSMLCLQSPYLILRQARKLTRLLLRSIKFSHFWVLISNLSAKIWYLWPKLSENLRVWKIFPTCQHDPTPPTSGTGSNAGSPLSENSVFQSSKMAISLSEIAYFSPFWG
jgi:hypothetical protein